MDELKQRIKRHIRRQYVIVVLSGAGAGKTTMTAAIGQAFKACRPDYVIAVDAVPGFGALAGRIDENPPGDYAALLKESDVQGYRDVREYLGQDKSVGLDVLAGDRASDRPRPLTLSMYDGVLNMLRRSHNVIIVDCGDDLEHPVMPAVLRSANMLVLVSGLTADTSVPVGRSINWLKAAGYHRLVSRSMVILNDNRGNGTTESRRVLAERFARAGAIVEGMPYDPFLSKGGIVDINNELKKTTRLRLYEITAKLADYYMPDADRPARPTRG